MPQTKYDQADDNGQATRHAGSNIPIIEHAQIVNRLKDIDDCTNVQ